jgi:hypothetical protein
MGQRRYLDVVKVAPSASRVEIVPGHQTARFASERQEKRGLK